MLFAIDRNRCPPSNGMPVRHHLNTQYGRRQPQGAILDAIKTAVRTAIVLAGHIALAGVLVTAIWGSRTLHDVT
jgi:hypothetical protein